MGKTVAGLVNAIPLNDEDYLPISQAGAVNPVTAQPGDTRKVRARAIGDFVRGNHGNMVEGGGRDLMKILLGVDFDGLGTQAARNTAIAQVMAELRRRCNNSGQIDGSGIPDFRGLEIGDYLDGLDLSGIPASADESTPPQPWINAYKNNRIVLAGFNHYKGTGDIEVSSNHLLFAFRHVVARGRIKDTNNNEGGMYNTELFNYLRDTFAVGLSAALGGAYLCAARRLMPTKGSWAWHSGPIFLPNEYEVFGAPIWSEVGYGGGTFGAIPLFANGAYRIKRFNGARVWWWEESPSASDSTNFCSVYHSGYAGDHGAASTAGGVSPAFCVA